MRDPQIPASVEMSPRESRALQQLLPEGNLWSCRACAGAMARASASPARPSIWMCQRAPGSHGARDRCSEEGAMFHPSVNMSLGSHEGTQSRGVWGGGGRWRRGRDKEKEKEGQRK